jgi:hypothetical protein
MISPEGFAPANIFSILPLHDDCTRLAAKAAEAKENAARLEEEYWSAYNRYERLTKMLVDAEDRADIYIIERTTTDVTSAKEELSVKKSNYEAAYTGYESAFAAYSNCAKK